LSSFSPFLFSELTASNVRRRSYKFLQFPSEKDVALSVEVKDDSITISAARPVKGLILSFSNDVNLSDNSLDLVPGDERTISVSGLKKDTHITWRCMLSSLDSWEPVLAHLLRFRRSRRWSCAVRKD
jgi:hypothetical protein